MTSSKQHTRASIITHLDTAIESGLKHVVRQTKESRLRQGYGGQAGDRSPAFAKAMAGKQESGQADDGRRSTVDGSTLDSLYQSLTTCQRCRLGKTRTKLVFGVGNPKATLMFVGEGPGRDEDLQGEPFVGRAGQLLTKIIEAMGFKRSEIYIANVVKCRPPENRNPEPDEITQCMPFLKQQIALIQPKVIMCLGKFASQTLLETEIPISKLRGTFAEKDGVAIMPTFHPAYLLRNPSAKRIMWEDCKKVMEKLGVTPPNVSPKK